MKIIQNMVRCNHCGDVIESKYRHDYVVCKCGCCSVDGGHDYLRRDREGFADDGGEVPDHPDVWRTHLRDADALRLLIHKRKGERYV